MPHRRLNSNESGPLEDFKFVPKSAEIFSISLVKAWCAFKNFFISIPITLLIFSSWNRIVEGRLSKGSSFLRRKNRPHRCGQRSIVSNPRCIIIFVLDYEMYNLHLWYSVTGGLHVKEEGRKIKFVSTWSKSKNMVTAAGMIFPDFLNFILDQMKLDFGLKSCYGCIDIASIVSQRTSQCKANLLYSLYWPTKLISNSPFCKAFHLQNNFRLF